MAENENIAAMREALLKASDVLTEVAHHNLTEDYLNECLALIHAALSAPTRNCDVGTAREQTARLRKFCRKYPEDCQGCPCCHEPYAHNCWLV